MDYKDRSSEDILEICNMYTYKLQQTQEKLTKIPNCFILPFVFGDSTNYFSDNLVKKMDERYGKTIYYTLKNIHNETSQEVFKSNLINDLKQMRKDMARGIYSKCDYMYIPMIIMLSSKLVCNVKEYISNIIESLKDDFNISLDIYFIVDKYQDNIRENIKIAIDNVKEYKKIDHQILENIYFLGESNFIISDNSLDVAIDTLDINIFYKASGKSNYNWNFAIDFINKEKADYSGETLERFDCNWIASSYIKFDFCKYTILYYLRELIKNQLGSNDEIQDEILKNTGSRYISELDDKIDEYLNKIYPKEKLIKQMQNVPIISDQIKNIKIPKKSLFNIFKKNSEIDYAYRNVEYNLLNDRDYIINYIELNKVKGIEPFNVLDEIPNFNIINKLDKILINLKSSTMNRLNELTSRLNSEKGFLNRTNNLSNFMKQYINKYVITKVEICILNKKIELLDVEIEKINSKKSLELNGFKENKESSLFVIENLMNNLTFNNENFKDTVDRLLENKYSYEIFKFVPWNISIEEIIENVGESKFLDIVSDTLNSIYKEDGDKLSTEFKNIMDSKTETNKYCIKTKKGFISGQENCKPPVISNSTPMYYDYFERIMCSSSSDIKCE